jgi:hypothetical protein
MMTTRESGARKPRPMQCLLLAPEQHPRETLRQFLADNVERHASKVDETACLTEFQQRLAERDYDLVLVALDPSNPNPLGIVESVLRRHESVVRLRLFRTSRVAVQNRGHSSPLPPEAVHVEDSGCQGPGSARQAGISSECRPLIRAS